MNAVSDLSVLLRSMAPELVEGLFVFATLPPDAAVPAGCEPIMTFREREGLTLILPADEGPGRPAAPLPADLPVAFPCRMITLTVQSALHAVGFLAAITARLAAAGISVNAVAAFHHDHLFVPAHRAEEALAILRDLSRS